MHRVAPAIILSVRPHGEHGAIVRALTRDDGVQPGYVRGGRSRALRPVLQPGNAIIGEWRARTAEQLPALTLEPGHSRAGLHGEPLAAAGIEWLCALTAAALPEEQPYPILYDALDAVLTAIESAPSARGWAGALVRYELLLLGQLGFGLDLERCTVTGGTDDLAFVSPKSGAADWPDIFAAGRITAHFLARDILAGLRHDPMPARARLFDRFKRAVA